MSEDTRRPSEVTSIIGRECFDLLPYGVHGDDIERWREFRLKYHKASELKIPAPAFPLQLDFELSSSCNLRCSFCVHGRNSVPSSDPPRMMMFETFKRIMHEGRNHGLCSIKLNDSNEPLLRRDLAAFIYLAREHGVLNTFLSTNGVLLTQDYALDLIGAGLSKIMISIDAATAETYRIMRGRDLLPVVEKNVRQLVMLKKKLKVKHPLVRVNFLRTALNAGEEADFVRKWRGVVDMVGFQMQLGFEGSRTALYRRDREDLSKFRCSFPFKLISVQSNGDLLPCCTFMGQSMPLGNIAEMTIEQAWKSRTAKRLRCLHRRGEGIEIPQCRRCIKGV